MSFLHRFTTGDRGVFHLLVHFPGMVRANSASRSFFRICFLDAGGQTAVPSSIAFPDESVGSWSGSTAAGTQSVHMWGPGAAISGLTITVQCCPLDISL